MTGVAPFARGDVCLWIDRECVVVSRVASAEEREGGYLYTVRCIGSGMRTEHVPHGDLAPLLPPGAHPPPRPTRLIKHPPQTEREQAMGLIIYYLDRDLLEMDARVQEKPAPKFEEREPRRGDIVLTNNGAKWLWRGRRAEGGMMYFSVSLEGGHYAHRATPDRPSTSRVLVQSKLEQRLGELALFWEEQSEKRFSILEQCARAFSEAGHPGPLSHEDLPRAIREALTVSARKSPEEAYPDTTHVEAALHVLFEDGRFHVSTCVPKPEGLPDKPLWWSVGDGEFDDASNAARDLADKARCDIPAVAMPRYTEPKRGWHDTARERPNHGERVWVGILKDIAPERWHFDRCRVTHVWKGDDPSFPVTSWVGEKMQYTSEQVMVWSYAFTLPDPPDLEALLMKPPTIVSRAEDKGGSLDTSEDSRSR